MTRLLVVRHAQSVWNAAGRWQGWSDAPLSRVGASQAKAAGRALAASGVKPDVVASSDLLRARRTAELIAGEVGYQAPLLVDPDLREQDLGEWNGLTTAQVEARWPGAVEERRAGRLDQVPGGEPADHFLERCLGAVYALAGQGAEVTVVTHGGVLIALERALGAWRRGQRQPNLTGWWVEARGAPPDLELVPLREVNLLAMAAERVAAERTVVEKSVAAETVPGPS